MNIYDSGAAGLDRMIAAQLRRRPILSSSRRLVRPYRCSQHPASRFAPASPRPAHAQSPWPTWAARMARSALVSQEES